MICAIHQPNFFPWLGYFDKIRRADVMIFLDDVAYPRSGSGMGSWSNRVKIAVQGRAHWIGCPLRRYSGVKMIHEIVIGRGPWREKIRRTLDINYRRDPGYASTIEIVDPLLNFETDSLVEYNINAVTTLAVALGLTTTKYYKQSEMGVTGASTQLLVDLVRSARCDAYLAGGGAGGYQEDDLFSANGVELIYQNYSPAPYGPPETFIPGLSVIDYLMKVPAFDVLTRSAPRTCLAPAPTSSPSRWMLTGRADFAIDFAAAALAAAKVKAQVRADGGNPAPTIRSTRLRQGLDLSVELKLFMNVSKSDLGA